MSTRTAGDVLSFALIKDEAAEQPAEWRDLDRAVWRWVHLHGGDRLLAEVAAWASHADGSGHSALPLDEAPPGRDSGWTEEQIRELANSPMVVALPGDAAELALRPRPFVLEGRHFYLLRSFRAEQAVADALRYRRESSLPPCRPPDDQQLRELFNGSWSEAESRQRDAVRKAPGKRLMVLTGGPGTGKTTTVLRMLLAISRGRAAAGQEIPLVRIAAPTGKAAQRLGESLRTGTEKLQHLDDAWQPHLRALRAAESSTVHRLLGSRGRHGGFAYHADERLPADVVVVDEASMLDLGLLRALLAALPDDAALLLVGDADQLTSVGTGSVMMDVVNALEGDPRDDLVRLSHCFRADSRELIPINEAVRSGDPRAFDAAWQAAYAGGYAHAHHVPDVPRLRSRVESWTRRLRGALEESGIAQPVAANDDDALAIRLRMLRRQQLLCALREGPFGAVAVSASIAAMLRRRDELRAWDGSAWYPGRCVIITRNDAAANLFNGDVGVCVPVQDGDRSPSLRVLFDPTPEAAQAGRQGRLFDPVTLPPHEDAFALTIHKSQGSEYDHVAVLLPPDDASPLLTRQTLYTGLSRAKRSLELWSTQESTAKAIGTILSRHGRLASRITGAPEPGQHRGGADAGVSGTATAGSTDAE
jgi:exodeoxyribonuclease V alpha subunit